MRWSLLLILLAGCGPSEIAPRPTGSPASTDNAPDLRRLDRLVHAAANDARQAAGVATLAWSDDLAAIARAHSRDMAARDYFAHESPDGTTPQDRALAGGVECRVPVGGGRTLVGVSENLYTSTRYASIRTRTVGSVETRTAEWFAPQRLARRTIQSWLDSPGHRRNLLKATSRSHGIGVATDNADRVYVTQVLC